MPSGSKKRKAAKKKKELEVKGAPHPRNSTLPHSLGGEDLEYHNDKDSDGGDVSSPASQDNHNCHELMDQEEEVDKQEDGLRDQSSIHEHKSNEMTNEGEEMEKGTMEEESALHVEREFKVEDEPQSKNISIEYIQAPKESHEGILLRSSSSSSCSGHSEHESTAANKNKIVVDDTPSVELVKEVDSLSAGKVNDVGTVFTTDLDKAAMSESEVQVKKSAFNGSGLMENGEKKRGVVDESASVLEGTVKMELGKKEDEAIQTSHDNDAEASDAMDFAIQVIGEKVTLSCDVPKVHASIGDMGVGKKEDEAVQTSHDNDAKTSEPRDYATQEKGDTLTLSYDAPKIDGSIGADPVKDSELSECSDSQHQVGSALRPVQMTSWKGCCGLFELFTGSNR